MSNPLTSAKTFVTDLGSGIELHSWRWPNFLGYRPLAYLLRRHTNLDTYWTIELLVFDSEDADLRQTTIEDIGDTYERRNYAMDAIHADIERRVAALPAKETT